MTRTTERNIIYMDSRDGEIFSIDRDGDDWWVGFPFEMMGGQICFTTSDMVDLLDALSIEFPSENENLT